MNEQSLVKLNHIFPEKTGINKIGNLEIGGFDLSELVSEYGSPLYIYDEKTIRNCARSFLNEFKSKYNKMHVSYSSKAFINPALVKILNEENLGIDVVSGGELEVLIRSEFPMEKTNFHGNNKSEHELNKAVKNNIGLITIDSFYELDILDEICKKNKTSQNITLRLSPSVDPHTHELTSTGILDTKFGFSIETGAAKKALNVASSKNNLNLKGVHFHLGSPIFELKPYSEAINYVFKFLEKNYPKNNKLEIFNVGGGFAVSYNQDDPIVDISLYANTICEAVNNNISNLGIDPPELVIEPGRAIVARSGVAIYTVGGIKNIPNLRTYVSVDGGMADNIRPALYGSKYTALSINKAGMKHDKLVTIAGKYCETGDKLVENVLLPNPEPKDLIAIPASGAYNSSMSSNYNVSLRPAILLISEDKIKIIRRRETYDDVLITSEI